MNVIVSFVLFQFGWFACVLGGVQMLLAKPGNRRDALLATLA